MVKHTLLLSVFLICTVTYGQSLPQMRYADKIRIKEAITIAKKYNDNLYKGYSTVPFAILLVTDSTEFLINHPNPSTDFTLLGHDSILNTTIYYRKTKFNIHFLATFPAVNGLSCIVVGTPENTNKNSTEWIITLLHEHFHQYQSSYPDYYKSANELNLSGGDQTGMWMLNYPFPYDSLPVIKQYERFANALHKTVVSIGSKEFKRNAKEYFLERRKLKELLPPAHYRYFSFQIWQEGIARYTEYRYAEMLDTYQPSKELLALPDFTSFADVKEKMYRNETKNIIELKLNEAKRVCFYSIGFAEGLILDKLNRKWRDMYMTDKFFIELYSKRFR